MVDNQMINNIFDIKTFSSHQGTDAESALSEHEPNIHQKINHISNPPLELKQNIAFRLDASSYENFRNASKEMTDDLPSFRYMLASLKNNNCTGQLREDYKSVLYGNLNQRYDDQLDGIWTG